jgi:hypothetical protein
MPQDEAKQSAIPADTASAAVISLQSREVSKTKSPNGMMKFLFRKLYRPYDDIVEEIAGDNRLITWNRGKRLPRKRKLDWRKLWNLLSQPIGTWGPVAIDFLDHGRRYRKWSFPHYVLADKRKFEELRSLLKYDHSSLIVDGVVGQTMHALGLAWSYFPHSWGIRCGNKRTTIEVFNNDALLRKAIVKMIRHTSNSRLTESVLRKGLRSFSGTQAVSNFRPTAAAAIYHKYLPENGVTWDMSSGWGGRLLGAIACRRVLKYIGTDPSTETINGLRKMAGELLPMAQQQGRNLEVELHRLGSEVFVPDEHKTELGIAASPRCPEQRRSIIFGVGIGRAEPSRNSYSVLSLTSSPAR